MYIANTPFFLESTKHKADYYFIRDMEMSTKIVTSMTSGDQIGDIFTKTLRRKKFHDFITT